MPGVYIGTSPLKCAYVGTTPVKCIYVGTTKVRPNTRKGIDLFLVGGGGAGGAGWYRTLAGYGYWGAGGGGGAGGVWCQTGLELQTGSYCVKVGAGGVKDTFTSTTTGGGCPSQFCGNGVNYTVCGGGYGAGGICPRDGTVPLYCAGGSGGSGGGGQGGCYCRSGGSHTGCGTGNAGGAGATGGYGGGGGGAGFHGGASGVICSRAGGYGGCGCNTTFFGAAKCIAGGGNGGGCYCRNYKLVSDSSSVSNTYGGGYGAALDGCGGDATCYGGGGGGGGWSTSSGCFLKGGHGYQGIVGIRYPSSCGYNITGGNCKYLCNGYCIHCFTSNGTLTIN